MRLEDKFLYIKYLIKLNFVYIKGFIIIIYRIYWMNLLFKIFNKIYFIKESIIIKYN